MYVDEGTANDVWSNAVQALLTRGAPVPSRLAGTLELHPALLHVVDPCKPLVTAYGRPVNPAFALAEVIWILMGRDDVAMLQRYNSSIGDYSDDGETFNAAYGYRIRSEFGHDQLLDVIAQLIEKPDTRQAILQIWSPSKDFTYQRRRDSFGLTEYAQSTKDRACNITGHALIRDGRLDWTQFVRSNDVIWGTPNNFMQWMHIQQFVAGMVGVPVGSYYHVADSLHMYDYHQEQARLIEQFDLYEELGFAHKPMDASWSALNMVADYEDAIRTGTGDTLNPFGTKRDYWHQVCEIFRAWDHYKDGRDDLAHTVLLNMTDQVLACAQARYFYWWRWHKDEYAQHRKTLWQWPVRDRVQQWMMARHQPAAVK
jgi:thymidylate synthase